MGTSHKSHGYSLNQRIFILTKKTDNVWIPGG